MVNAQTLPLKIKRIPSALQLHLLLQKIQLMRLKKSQFNPTTIG
jgi:hypothetical protein